MSHSLDRFLANTDAAGSVMAHARLLQKLARIYENSAPEHLARASRVANYKSGTVVIHADNGAVAVKLRQMAPTLANEFSKRGVECNGVQVKVQAIEISQHFQPPTGHELPAGAGQVLSELAAGMAASPLRDAIRTLVERSAKKE